MKNEKLAYIKKDTDDQTNGYISFKDGANIRIPEAIGYLRHEETGLKSMCMLLLVSLRD